MARTVIIPEQYRKILLKLKVLKRFDDNIRRFYRPPYNKTLNTINRANSFEEFISIAFVWDATPEGHVFWESVSREITGLTKNRLKRVKKDD